uniref:C-type lectin domain-containing protein n=1 Tax=Plectus sambesii TaxID=2011161 RepID=A0A914V169_9BILA
MFNLYWEWCITKKYYAGQAPYWYYWIGLERLQSTPDWNAGWYWIVGDDPPQPHIVAFSPWQPGNQPGPYWGPNSNCAFVWTHLKLCNINCNGATSGTLAGYGPTLCEYGEKAYQ